MEEPNNIGEYSGAGISIVVSTLVATFAGATIHQLHRHQQILEHRLDVSKREAAHASSHLLSLRLKRHAESAR
ncbi:hypothetical protein ACTOVP_04015 [Arcanobacterium canis]